MAAIPFSCFPSPNPSDARRRLLAHRSSDGHAPGWGSEIADAAAVAVAETPGPAPPPQQHQSALASAGLCIASPWQRRLPETPAGSRGLTRKKSRVLPEVSSDGGGSDLRGPSVSQRRNERSPFPAETENGNGGSREAVGTAGTRSERTPRRKADIFSPHRSTSGAAGECGTTVADKAPAASAPRPPRCAWPRPHPTPPR